MTLRDARYFAAHREAVPAGIFTKRADGNSRIAASRQPRIRSGTTSRLIHWFYVKAADQRSRNFEMEDFIMTNFSDLSNRDWGASKETPHTPPKSDDYASNQEGKSAKAIIGLAILVALGVGFAVFKPTSNNLANAPMQERGSEMTQMHHAPSQTTGQAPTSAN